MKRSFFAVLAVMLSVGLWGRTPERRVMYTLPPGEVLDIGEYIVQYSLSGSKFALITYNPQTKKSTLVFNGKPIVTSEKYLGDIYTLGYINVDEPDGYVVKVWDGKDYYVNRGGKMEGPYEYVFWDYPEDYEYQYRYGPEPPAMSKNYRYVLADRVYENVDGKRQKSKGVYYLGDIDEDRSNYCVAVNDVLVSYSSPGVLYTAGNNYAYVCRDGNADYLYVNGEWMDTGSTIYNVILNSQGDCVYKRRGEDASGNYYDYLMKNGKVLDSTGYFLIDHINLTADGEVAYISKKDGKCSLHLPGMPVDSTFEDIRNLVYFDKEHYGFVYKKEEKYYVRITGQQDMGPYEGVADLLLNKDGRFIYSYWNSQNLHFKTADGEYGPFDRNWGSYTAFSENGGYVFGYSDDGVVFWNKDGVVRKSDNNGCWMVDLEKNGHNFYSKFEYDYVVIDGVRIGNSAALQARYDEAKNAFVWLSLEGQELVVYEYRLD